MRLGVILIVAILVIGLVTWGFATREIRHPDNAGFPTDKGLEVCPDHWYDNQMPSYEPNISSTQYFVLDGERRELNEFDVDWVMDNCDLEIEVVY